VENPDYGPEEQAYAKMRDAWDDAIITAQQSYNRLIDAGVPAEDARGLMPHSMTTRYHWSVSLRTLLGEAGKRLCTQAQFEWRMVMSEVVKALREYGADSGSAYQLPGVAIPGVRHAGWQFKAIADALQPICYQEGHCGFMAKFDRGCKIRPRVERFAANNVRSESWDSTGQYDVTAGPSYGGGIADGPDYTPLTPIHPKEWLTDPGAAR